MKSTDVPTKPNDAVDAEPNFPDLVMHYGGEAVREAIAEHHRAGNPVAVWREGRVLLLYPDGSIGEPEPVTP